MLRNGGVQKFGRRSKSHVGHVGKELARNAKANVDLERTIDVRIVDEALPADGGSWLFEVAPHHYNQFVRVSVGQLLQFFGVIQHRDRIVDRAWANDQNQPLVFSAQRSLDLASCAVDEICSLIGERDLFDKNRRRQKRPNCRHT